MLNKEENKEMEEEQNKEGERGILREAGRGRELVSRKEVGRRMEKLSNLKSGF